MLTKSLFSLLSKSGTVILAGYIAWLALGQLAPHKPEIGPLRMEAADEAVSAIAEDLRQNSGDGGSVLLIHFAGDPTDYFTDQLRSMLEQRGILDLQDQSFMEKTRDLANLRESTIDSPEAAIELAKPSGASGVLFGWLVKFESTPGEAFIDVEYTLADVATGETIYDGRYSNTSSASELLPAEATTFVRSFPWFKRGLGWLVIVLLLPVFTIGFIRTMVARRSNGVNAFMLAIYTVANAILAYLLVGAALAGFWSVLFFILAVVAAFAYSVRIMAFALKLEEG